jgi:hypothetical protein
MADSSLHIEIKGLDKLMRDFEGAGVNYRPLLTQAMVKGTVRLKNKIQDNIRQKGITFQGSLGRSVVVTEATYSRGVVGIGERYGGAVEFGRRPGKMPPVEPLERWAAIKLGTPGIGFVIARKIARQGTKAQPFVEPAFKSEIDYVLKQFSDATDILLQRIGGAN